MTPLTVELVEPRVELVEPRVELVEPRVEHHLSRVTGRRHRCDLQYYIRHTV